MNTNRQEADTAAGSIAVTQRLPPGKMPARTVKVFRCVWHSMKGGDGKSYGRTKNLELLAVPSETPALLPEHEELLRRRGLTDVQIAHVNVRLAECAELAKRQAHNVTVRLAEQRLGSITAWADRIPSARKALRALMAKGVALLADAEEAAIQSKEPAEVDRPAYASPGEHLLDSLQQLNRAAGDVQFAYRQLAKGEEPPTAAVLEFQRSWFLVQGMVEALRGRECFYRPGGWSELKQQVIGEARPWRKGDPVPKKGVDGGAA